MASLLAVFVFVGVVSLAAADEPSFCNKLDCPKYTLVEKKSGYEIRKYEESKWVGTTIASTSYTDASYKGFNMLFNYISGENEDHTKIPMAAPVAVKIVPGDGEEANFTVLFFTPFAYDVNTPVPTNTELSIVNLPALTAYVNSFGGYEDNKQLHDHAMELKDRLMKDNMNFVQDYYFTAGYDSPYRVFGRHNEVWMIATE